MGLEVSRDNGGTRPVYDRARSTAFRTGNTPGSWVQPSGDSSDDARSAVVGDDWPAGIRPRLHAAGDVDRGVAVAGQILRDPLGPAAEMAHHEQFGVRVDLPDARGNLSHG